MHGWGTLEKQVSGIGMHPLAAETNNASYVGSLRPDVRAIVAAGWSHLKMPVADRWRVPYAATES